MHPSTWTKGDLRLEAWLRNLLIIDSTWASALGIDPQGGDLPLLRLSGGESPCWIWHPREVGLADEIRLRWGMFYPERVVRYNHILYALGAQRPDKWITLHCATYRGHVIVVPAVASFKRGFKSLVLLEMSSLFGDTHWRLPLAWVGRWQRRHKGRHESLVVALDSSDTNHDALSAYARRLGVEMEIVASDEACVERIQRYASSAGRRTWFTGDLLSAPRARPQRFIRAKRDDLERLADRLGLFLPPVLPKGDYDSPYTWQWLIYSLVYPHAGDVPGRWLWYALFRELLWELPLDVRDRLAKLGLVRPEEDYALTRAGVAALAARYYIGVTQVYRWYRFFLKDAKRRIGHTQTVYRLIADTARDIYRRSVESPSEWGWVFGAGEVWGAQLYTHKGQILRYRPDGFLSFKRNGQTVSFLIEMDGWRDRFGRGMRSRSTASIWDIKLRRVYAYYLSNEWRHRYVVFPSILVVTESKRNYKSIARSVATWGRFPSDVLVTTTQDVQYGLAYARVFNARTGESRFGVA